jgi:hypothetical protein
MTIKISPIVGLLGILSGLAIAESSTLAESNVRQQIIIRQNNTPFRVGEVKKRFPTEFCGVLLPDNDKPMLNFDRNNSKIGWININGKDIKITRVSLKTVKPKQKWISEYRGQNIFVVLDSTLLRTVEEPLTTDEFQHKVKFIRGSQSQTIVAKGLCIN